MFLRSAFTGRHYHGRRRPDGFIVRWHRYFLLLRRFQPPPFTQSVNHCIP